MNNKELQLNPRQCSLLIWLGVTLDELIARHSFDCRKINDREEILRVVEVFFENLHKGHVSLSTDDKEHGKSATS